MACCQNRGWGITIAVCVAAGFLIFQALQESSKDDEAKQGQINADVTPTSAQRGEPEQPRGGQPTMPGHGGEPEQPRQPERAAMRPDPGEFLIRSLESSPGCVGVDAGQMRSGKNVIFAWFEDKDAALKWYYHPVHQQMKRGLNAGEREPLAHVPDGVPILVAASITPSDRAIVPGTPFPISQIAIELYTPLPGGAAINGRFAPDEVPVEHMLEQTIEPEGGQEGDSGDHEHPGRE